jgi:DNA-directed RNA polymerase subunit RPC12/RpoP
MKRAIDDEIEAAPAPPLKFCPCFLCSNPLDVRWTYKEKPYLVCDFCGIQIFIRGKNGIAAFNKFIDQNSKAKK